MLNAGSGFLFTKDPVTGENRLSGEFFEALSAEELLTQDHPLVCDSGYIRLGDGNAPPELSAEMQKGKDGGHEYTACLFAVDGQPRIVYRKTMVLGRGAMLRLLSNPDLPEEYQKDIIRNLDDVGSELLVPLNTKPVYSARGLSRGPAVGRVCFDAKNASGDSIVVKNKISPSDVMDLKRSAGLFMAWGDPSSHPIILARGYGIPCIAAHPGDLRVNGTFASLNGVRICAGDALSFDGSTGDVYHSRLPIRPCSPNIALVLGKYCKTKIYANADSAEEARVAFENGAEGIGLCRTEHLFLGSASSLAALREVLFSNGGTGVIKDIQVEEFRRMDSYGCGRPIVVRLLDSPLHEFLPESERVESFDSSVLGVRGARLGALMGRVYDAQVEAVSEGFESPRILVPFTMNEREVQYMVNRIRSIAPRALIGSMIELPSAAYAIDRIAEVCDFLCFGTNDLTQTFYGLAREGSGVVIAEYQRLGLLEVNPFETLGGELAMFMRDAVSRVRGKKSIGVCGEQCDYASVKLYSAMGIDYLSCGPFSVPNTRLNAAKAALGVCA